MINYPVIWYKTDQTGTWDRLKNRLKLHNLKFYGSKVAPTVAANSVRELILSLVSEGASPDFHLENPLGYNSLMKELESRGIVEPIPTHTPRKVTDKVEIVLINR